MQCAGFAHHDIEETANQNRLLGEQILRTDAEASRFFAQLADGNDMAPGPQRDGLKVTGPVVFVIATVNRAHHFFGQVPFAQQVGQVAFKQFEELVHGAVHAGRGPAL